MNRDWRQNLGHFARVLSVCLGQGEIIQSAIVIAYYILFSIFPIIIIVGNVLPLFKIDSKPIADYLQLVFPNQVSGFIMPIIDSLLKKKSTGYISFGIVLAVWSFSCLINAIRIGMNRLYGVHLAELRRSFLTFLWNRTLTVILTSIMILVFTAVILIFTFGQQILNLLAPIFHFSLAGVNKILSYRWPVITGMMILGVYYLDFVLPNVKLQRRHVWPGVLLTVAGWLALSSLFGFYLHNFPISWENYGIVGTFIIFMLWLNLASLLLLFGVSINASLDRIKYGPSQYSSGRLADYLRRWRK
jgi:membrane protein